MFLIPWAIALLFLLNVVVTVVLWILGDTERLRQEVHRATASSIGRRRFPI